MVRKNLERHVKDPMYINIISLMGLYYGAYKSVKPLANLAKIITLEDGFENIAVGRESAEIFGRLKADLEKAGTRLDDFDIIIAACAMRHNLTLVTNNTKHFNRIEGLKLANWTKDPENR